MCLFWSKFIQCSPEGLFILAMYHRQWIFIAGYFLICMHHDPLSFERCCLRWRLSLEIIFNDQVISVQTSLSSSLGVAGKGVAQSNDCW